jgi:hypothetical protein
MENDVNMSVQHTIPTYRRAPSIHDTLLSTVPEGLQRLVTYREDLPASFYFSVADLDEVVDGKNTDAHLDRVGDGLYLEGILPSIDWWVGVLTCLSFGRTMEGVYGDFASEPQRKALLPLLNNALSS